MVQGKGDSHGGRQHLLAILLQRLPPKSRRDFHQKIAGGAMISRAFHPIISHIFCESKEGLGLLILVKGFMSEDRFGMEIGCISALLDIDRAIVVRNGEDSSNLLPPMLLSSLSGRSSLSSNSNL